MPATHHTCAQGHVRVFAGHPAPAGRCPQGQFLGRVHTRMARIRQDCHGTLTVRPGAADARSVHQAEGRHVNGLANQPATADARSAHQCFDMQQMRGAAHQAKERQHAHRVDEAAKRSRREERALGGSGCSRSAHQAKERGNADSADTAARCTMYSVAAKSRHFFALPTCAPDHAVCARDDVLAAHHSNVVESGTGGRQHWTSSRTQPSAETV